MKKKTTQQKKGLEHQGASHSDLVTQTNWGIIGHRPLVLLLQHIVKAESYSHAYLLTGVASLGKTTLARAFAQTILCQDRSTTAPCGRCTSCHQYRKGIHPDIVEINAAETQASSVEHIRSLRTLISRTPSTSSRKAVIISDAHQLSRSASNALLKNLEEPTEDTVFILTAQSPALTLSTLSSRCQQLYVAPVPDEIIYEALTSRELSSHDARTLTSYACGRPGIALQCIDHQRQRELYDSFSSAFTRMLGAGIAQRFPILTEMIPPSDSASRARTERATLEQAFSFWAVVLHRALYTDLADSSAKFAPAESTAVARKYSTQKIAALLRTTLKATSLIQRNVQARLLGEELALSL